MELQQVTQAIQHAVQAAISDGSYRHYAGRHTAHLTAALAERLAVDHVILTCSGTVAMELALRAAGVSPGDRVLLSAYDYPGNFSAIERVGARPVLVDTELHGWAMDPTVLEIAWKRGGEFKALIASHLHGQLQPAGWLRQRCEAAGLMFIEDACQAVGASLAGRPVGSFGHVATISFGGGKLLSAGRGGAAVTSDNALAQRLKNSFGPGSGSYGLSEVQAAVVAAQLPWLDSLLAHTRSFFGQLANALQGAPSLSAPYAEHVSETSFYQAGLLLAQGGAGSDQLLGESQRLALLDLGLTAGGGFAGFHRRSPRRCEHVEPLVHTANIAARTLTLHYSTAWATNTPPQTLAALLCGEGHRSYRPTD